MVNQIKADFYKFYHSVLFKVFCIITVGLFVIFCFMSNTDEGYVMGYVLEKVNGFDVLQGFASYAFEDFAAPTYWDIIYTSVSMTLYLWILFLVIGIMFFSKDFTTGVIKLSYAKGNSKIKVFLSKLTVISITYLCIFQIFNISAFLFVSLKFNGKIMLSGLKDLLITSVLMFLPLVIMVLMSMTLFLWFQSAAPVTTIMMALMFSHIFVIMSFLESGDAPWMIKLYYAINPMSYIWVASNFWAYPIIIGKILIYFVVGILSLSGCACYLLRAKEVK